MGVLAMVKVEKYTVHALETGRFVLDDAFIATKIDISIAILLKFV